MNIDLKQLSLRESERVEWKENRDDRQVVQKIVKTISAFANDIANVGGGYVVCGAKEGKDEHGFPKVFYTGLSANKLKEIVGKVTQHCRDYVSPPIVPLVTELENPNELSSRVLVFTVIASPDVHLYRGGEKSAHYVRVGSETRIAKNGILQQLLIKKQKIVAFGKRANNKASEADIDIALFRDYMQEMRLLSPNKSLEDYFSENAQIAEFVPPLFDRIGLDRTLRPKNFALLIFGKRTSISRLFPEAYTVLSIYKGKDRSEPTAERHLLTGTLFEQTRKAVELLNTEAYVAFDKFAEKPNQVKYPKRALQESVINAIVHRDYELEEPNRITVFSDRIEVRSPGALHWAVDKEKFKAGKASPKWRNQSFAYLFNKIQLAQSEGQGIPTILRSMREEGCPDPIFELESESLTCILPAHPRHQVIRELQQIQDDVILGHYARAEDALKRLLREDAYNYRALNLLVEVVNKRNNYRSLYEFLAEIQLDYYGINSDTLLEIADSLRLEKGHEAAQALANEMLDVALSGRLEERQVIKAATTLARIGTDEELIKFVSEKIARYPKLAENAELLLKRAYANINLAYKCENAARTSSSSSKTRERAWQKCIAYLERAKEDRNLALIFAKSSTENTLAKSYINYLDELDERIKQFK